jgi:hypothetical protein
MIALWVACFTVAAKDVMVRWGLRAPLGAIAVAAPRLVTDLSGKLIGSDALLTFGSFISGLNTCSNRYRTVICSKSR